MVKIIFDSDNGIGHEVYDSGDRKSVLGVQRFPNRWILK
jgi:hypothetical protein